MNRLPSGAVLMLGFLVACDGAATVKSGSATTSGSPGSGAAAGSNAATGTGGAAVTAGSGGCAGSIEVQFDGRSEQFGAGCVNNPEADCSPSAVTTSGPIAFVMGESLCLNGCAGTTTAASGFGLIVGKQGQSFSTGTFTASDEGELSYRDAAGVHWVSGDDHQVVVSAEGQIGGVISGSFSATMLGQGEQQLTGSFHVCRVAAPGG